MSVTDVLSLGLSVLALGFAAYSFLRQFKLQRRHDLSPVECA